MDKEPIAALSSPRGKGGIAVIRATGEGISEKIGSIFETDNLIFSHSRCSHTYIIDNGERVEECMVSFFKGPRSYSGEDLIEIMIHSNPFLIEKVLEIIFQCGVRPAMPGEFTYRAYLNGKMDLIQAESVNDLINANSRYHAEMKFKNLEGKLSGFLARIKEGIVETVVALETFIEFGEDQDLTEIKLPENLNDSLKKIEEVLSSKRNNELMNRGPVIAIAGKVNTGKSSLFNRILLEERSIISEEPGTTRDFIREKIYIKDMPVELVDVAGVNVFPSGDVEKRGIERGIDIIWEADGVIILFDSASKLDENDTGIYKLAETRKHLVVLNKIDLKCITGEEDVKKKFPGERVIPVSVLKNENLEEVIDFISDVVEDIIDDETGLSVNLRQKNLLTRLSAVLQDVDRYLKEGRREPELIAEDLRTGLGIIGELLGEVSTEEILADIFGSFCIGK